MKQIPQQGRRIVWLVRLLAAIGLAIVVTTTGLVGWTLARVRAVRAQATAEQARLDQASKGLRDRAVESRIEIQTVLDETVARSQKPSVVADFDALIHSQLESRPDPAVWLSLTELDAQVERLPGFAGRVNAWRDSYGVVWEDLRQQKTMGRVRDLITRLRTSIEVIEGRRRLDEAIKYRRWRKAGGEEAARQAGEILLEQARRQSRDSADFKNQLAEFARLVELLGGEEHFDSLTDLKDNKLKPVLDRMSRSIAAFGAEAADEAALQPRAIEDFRVALFGEGYVSDDAHQNVQVGRGGLFTLRRDALQLRREREKLKNDLAELFQNIEAANAGFAQSTQIRTTALAQEMEQSLAAGWRQMLIFGGGCTALFLWLAWVIARGVNGQVNAIDRARAEAVQENAERRQAEEALRKNEAQLQTMVENLTEGVAVSGLNGQLLHFNRAALAMHGFGGVEESRRHLSEFASLFELSDLDGAALPVEQWPLSRILRGDNLRDLEVRVRRRDAGWERVFSYGGSLVHDADGRPLLAVVTISDITERKEAEQQMERLRNQHSTVLNSLTEGLHWVGLDGQIRYENRAAAKMLGYEVAELIGRPAHATMHHTRVDGAAYPQAECNIYATMRDGEVRLVKDEVFWRKDGTSFPVQYTCTPSRDENGQLTGSVVAFADITERKKAEQELDKAQRQLVETSRMAGMAEVATGVLHNVGNVLNSVNVSATLVADKVKKSKSVNLGKVAAMLREHEGDLGAFLTTDAKGKQVPGFLGTLAEAVAAEQAELLKELANLQKNIEHIKDVVAMQQNYAKISAVTETVKLDEMLDDTLRMNAESLTRHDVQVVREFGDAPPVEVDKHKLLQILVNLVRNAKQACDASGREDKQLTLRLARDGDRVKISVSDNGVGIAPENLDRVFNHGFTTKKEGHGFGLHSSANAAKEMGGSLTLQSEGAGRGATFTIELPLKSAGREVAPAMNAPQLAA